MLLSIPAAATAGQPVPFVDVAKSSGVDFTHNFGSDHLENVLMTTGSGCAFFDYDNDGWLDVFLVNGTRLDKAGMPTPSGATSHGLFRNRGDGTFENVTVQAGLSRPSYGQGCALGDYDGDGFTDIYLTNYGANQFYRNQGDGTFADVTAATGTGDSRWSAGAVFFDYDGDRDLDLAVTNYLKFTPNMGDVKSSALSKRTGFSAFPGPRDYEPEPPTLYRNNGDGSFTDVTREAGMHLDGRGLTVVAADFDNDGDQDLFVANDKSPNFLFQNNGGVFTDVAMEAGVAYDPDGVETAGMGIAMADVNRDGYQDMYVTNMIFEFNNMYMNLADMMFSDDTKALGLDEDNFRHVGWAAAFLDFNLDGYLDCFVTNGHLVDFIEGFSQSITYAQRNMLFMGEADGQFTDVAGQCGKAFKEKRVSRGAAFGDYDNDGDIDILVSNSGQRAQLLRNDLPANGRWLKIHLLGLPPNTAALGATVQVRWGEHVQNWVVHTGGSYLSGNPSMLHLGLPPTGEEGTVTVTWPDGRTTVHQASAGTLLRIQEEPAAD